MITSPLYKRNKPTKTQRYSITHSLFWHCYAQSWDPNLGGLAPNSMLSLASAVTVCGEV